MGNKDAFAQLANEHKAKVEQTATDGLSTAPANGADAEIKDMLAEVDLLSLIQSDTQEQGHGFDGCIGFDTCPVCGHRDCFRFYPSTNSWACFGASNESGYEGGTALEYYKATREDDNVAAVKWLREQTGHPYEPAHSDAFFDSGGSQTNGSADIPDRDLKLPPWTSVRSVDPPARKPVLIPGILRRGHVGLLSGKGKIGKTTCATELSIATAANGTWLGLPIRDGGDVLFIDPETDRESLDNRFHWTAIAMGVDPAIVDSHVVKWCLRGVAEASMDAIIHDLKARGVYGKFALVVIDSCSCFVEGDENKSVDVRRFASKALQVAALTGASVLLIHHYGKTPDGNRDAADRARGSSVWLDFPDAVLTLTEVLPASGDASDFLEDGEYACVLESGGIREFGRLQPIRCIFSYPIHRVDIDGITDNWKPKSGKSDGGKATGKGNQMKSELRARDCESALVAELMKRGIPEDGIPAKEAAEIATEHLGDNVNPQTLKKYVEKSSLLYPNQVSTQRWCVAFRPELTQVQDDPQQSLDLSD